MSEPETAKQHYEQGLRAEDARDRKMAIVEFRRAIELDPRHAEAYRQLGWNTYATGGALEDACRCLQTAIRLKPLIDDAHLYLGIVLNRLGKTAASEHHFRVALVLDDPAITHATFAEEFLWHNGRYGEAEGHFKKALMYDPDCVLALRDYARMLACHGRNEEAKRLFDKAIEIDPDDRHTMRAFEEYRLGVMSADRDSYDRLRAAVERDPDYAEGIRRLKGK